MAQFKECGCGVSIPVEWEQCGQAPIDAATDLYEGQHAARIAWHKAARQANQGFVPTPPPGEALKALVEASKRSRGLPTGDDTLKARAKNRQKVADAVKPAFLKLMEREDA